MSHLKKFIKFQGRCCSSADKLQSVRNPKQTPSDSVLSLSPCPVRVPVHLSRVKTPETDKDKVCMMRCDAGRLEKLTSN